MFFSCLQFFHFTYTFVAQHGPEEDEYIQEHLEKGMGNRIHEWVQGQEGNIDAAASVGLDGQTVDAKFINWQTWAEFYDDYLLHSCATSSEQAGMNCFRACFEKNWSGIFIFFFARPRSDAAAPAQS